MTWIKMIWAFLKALFSFSKAASGGSRADFELLTQKYKELYDDMYKKQEARILALEQRVGLLEDQLEKNEVERDELWKKEMECAETNKRLLAELSELRDEYDLLRNQINNNHG